MIPNNNRQTRTGKRPSLFRSNIKKQIRIAAVATEITNASFAVRFSGSAMAEGQEQLIANHVDENDPKVV